LVFDESSFAPVELLFSFVDAGVERIEFTIAEPLLLPQDELRLAMRCSGVAPLW
jgi:hypothetical protein